MSNYITTHNSEGKAIFSGSSGGRTKLDTPIGSMEVLYTTHNVPTNVASEADIDQYSQDAKGALGNRLCPEKGTAAAVLNISPNSESPFHRTMTLDMFLVIEGDLELLLDSGEKRTLHAGDCVTQRVSLKVHRAPKPMLTMCSVEIQAVMHKWKNVTANDGWAKAVAIAQPIAEPFEIAGNKLETEFVV